MGHAEIRKTSYGHHIPEYTHVLPKYQRKGIASAMYNASEAHTGQKIEPSSVRSDDAIQFWKNRR